MYYDNKLDAEQAARGHAREHDVDCFAVEWTDGKWTITELKPMLRPKTVICLTPQGESLLA